MVEDILMKIIAVDDEVIALEGLMDAIREAVPTAELNGFECPEDALEFVDENECNIAFLDVEMPGMSGVTLSEQLKLRNPDINIIFATGYDRYYKDAFDVRASGYLTKPIKKSLLIFVTRFRTDQRQLVRILKLQQSRKLPGNRSGKHRELTICKNLVSGGKI